MVRLSQTLLALSQHYLFRKVRSYINAQSALKFYTTYIRPKLMYCSSLFINASATFTTPLKALQNKSVRVILRAPKAFSVSLTQYSCTWDVPLATISQVYLKLLKQKVSFYIKKVLSSANTHSKSLLNSCPFGLLSRAPGLADLTYNNTYLLLIT